MLKFKTCRECGISADKVDFKPKASICKPCNAKYMSEYRKKNREKISGQIQNWKENNRDRYRQSCRDYYATPKGKQMQQSRLEKAPRVWLAKKIRTSYKISNKPGPHDPKFGPKCDHDIDIDYIMDLWDKQNGLCALTGLKMLHETNNPLSASIDRVDNAYGHVVGNVQIVCEFANCAKRHYDNDLMLEIFNRIRYDKIK